MRIAVASGKGGTGKTLVATNLAWALAERTPDVTYLDADVEGPNGHLLLHPTFTATERHAVSVPALVRGRCSGCGLCEQACAFNAIVAAGTRVTVFSDLCHSCGVCLRACEEEALTEVEREIGTIRRGHVGHAGFVDGTLDVGEVRATPLIQAVVRQGRATGHTVVDAPPGTSCAAIAAVEGADLVLLVSEPTPFGLHDLELSLQMCSVLKLEVAAFINRCDLGDVAMGAYLADRGVPLVGELPFDRQIATACAEGVLASNRVPAFASVVGELTDHILAQSSRLTS